MDEQQKDKEIRIVYWRNIFKPVNMFRITAVIAMAVLILSAVYDFIKGIVWAITR